MMIKVLVAGVVLGAFGLVACDNDKKEAASKEVATPAAKTPGEVKNILDQLDQAKKAAASASAILAGAKGAPTCERAFIEMEQLIKVVQSMPGNKAKPTVPDKAAFLKTCRTAPAEMQKCVVLSYAKSHVVECKAINDKLDPAMKAKLKKMMEDAMAKGKK